MRQIARESLTAESPFSFFCEEIMIIGLWNPEPIGAIIEGTYERTNTEHYHHVRICILRKSSYEEWLAYREEHNIPFKIDQSIALTGHFYEVSTD